MEKYFEWVINKIWMNYHLFIFFYLLLNVFSSSDLSANRIDHLPPTAFENTYVRVVL